MIYDFSKDMDRIIESINNTQVGLLSGIQSLDDTILGFSPGELITIAGRPGMGKSSLARDIMLSVGAPDGEQSTIVLCTLEMSCEEVVDLLAANLAKIDYHAYSKGNVTEEVRSLFDRKRAQLSSYNIIVNDDSFLTPDSVREMLSGLIKTKTIACVIVDYLQLMSLRCVVESRQVEVSTISRELKAIAKEFNIPVIAISQLNRHVEHRESQRPRMSDLRDSGAMEQDSSKVILIHRPSYYLQQIDNNIEDDGEAELIVVKNRKGPQKIIKCAWMNEWMSFCDIPEEEF